MESCWVGYSWNCRYCNGNYGWCNRIYINCKKKTNLIRMLARGRKSKGVSAKTKPGKIKIGNQGLRLNLPKNTRRAEIVGSIKNAYLDTYQLAKES